MPMPISEPGHQVDGEAVGQREGREPGGEQDRAGDEDRTPTLGVDGAPDPGRDQPGREQADGQAAHDPAERPSGVGGDRLREHGGKVEGRSPGEDLRDPEGGDDHPRAWLRHGRIARQGLTHRIRHGRISAAARGFRNLLRRLRGAASAAGLALGLGLGIRDAAGVDLGRGGTAAASR